MSRTLYRRRAEIFPASPKNAEDIKTAFSKDNIMNIFGTTRARDDPRQFFETAHKESSFEYCLFSSRRSIELMTEHIEVSKRKLYFDGTFKVCPKSVFQQLFIIYVECYRQVGSMQTYVFLQTNNDF